MLEPHLQVLLSSALTFGVPLALAIRELILLDRDGGASPRAGDTACPLPLPLAPDGDASLPPLPSCLVEAARDRPIIAPAICHVLEDA